MCGGKPETRALAWFLGCKKRVEYLLDDSWGHPGSRVFHLQHNVAYRSRFDVHSSVGLVKLHILRRESEDSPLRHRVPRVDAQVHEHLVQLRSVSNHGQEILGNLGPDLDGFRKSFFDKLVDLANEVLQLHLRALAFNASRETQHLPYDICPTLRCRLDDLQDLAGALVGMLD